MTIPSKLRWNQKFLDQLLEKWKSLIAKQQKKKIYKIIEKDSLLLFWELVPLSEFSLEQKNLNLELKQTLYDYAKPILDDYSQKLWIPYKSLHIRKVKSKWWSCTSDQKIMLNQNLVHLPSRLIIYVIIHEACHLKIKNHSPKFWELVAFYSPNYKILRKELRDLLIVSN